jgi:hypothetical protein
MSIAQTKKTWRPAQNRVAGVLLTLSGFLMLISAPVVTMVGYRNDDGFLILLSLIMFLGCAVILILGKRHLTRSAEHILSHDTRQPVIYLRSFDAEADSFGLGALFRSTATAFTNRSMGSNVSAWDPTFQTQLALVMERIGPYIAVGRPGENLPGTGAARLYIPDSEWQHRVTELIRRSRLVVFRAGTGSGLQWEFDNLMRLLRPQQLLVILPITRKNYLAFRELMQKHGILLPEKVPEAMLMTFRDAWQPVFLKAGGNLEATLDPYFRANGIATPKHSIWDAVRLFFH